MVVHRGCGVARVARGRVELVVELDIDHAVMALGHLSSVRGALGHRTHFRSRAGGRAGGRWPRVVVAARAVALRVQGELAGVMIPSDVVVAVESIEWTHERVRTALDGLTDVQVTQPSRLPRWTRGHVLAHLANLGEAAARQLQNAYIDAPVVPFYDGGMEGRDAAIEADAGLSAAEHVARVEAALDRVEGLLDLLDEAALARRTGFRDRTAAALVLAWWRETSIHLTDLDLGVEHTMWGAALREHLVGYLSARVPDGLRLDLEPTDVDEPRYLGDGVTVKVTGAASDIVAWLAGRTPLEPLHATTDGAATPLPELGPWP